MESLQLDKSQVIKAFGLPENTDIEALAQSDKQKEMAIKHLEVQLKHIFWQVHDYSSTIKSDIQAAWYQFQTEIINYGCHCFVSGFSVGGAGPVQDKIDLACREYARCTRCIDIDRSTTDYFSDREKICTVHEPYYSKLKKEPKAENPLDVKTVQCGKGADEGGRQSNCQIANCKCDQAFSRAVAAWWKHRNIDNQNVFNKGINTICVNDVPIIGPPEACCGPYPTRRAYWTENQKSCCGVSGPSHSIQQLFSTVDKKCCDDTTGSVCDRDDI